jgi:hypothetical protein
MEFINHITLTTGHCRKTFPKEIAGRYYSIKRVYEGLFSKDGIEITEGFYAKCLENFEGGILIVVYSPRNLPILTSGISKYKNNNLWKYLHDSSCTPTITNPLIQPEAPYIADRIEIEAINYPNAMTWTADFTRCMGWMFISPESI